MAHPLAFFSALAVEAEPLREMLSEPVLAVDRTGLTVVTGTLEGHPAVLAVVGIGKVGMAAAVQHVCDLYQPALALVGGLAGGLQPAGHGELVIVTEVLQHDYDAQPLSSGPCVLPHLGLDWLAADPAVVAQLAAACAALHPAVAVSRAQGVSGDRLIRVSAERDALAARHPQARCVDMETAALAQVAVQNAVPWAALRVVSDSADEAVSEHGLLSFGSGGASRAVAEILVAAGLAALGVR